MSCQMLPVFHVPSCVDKALRGTNERGCVALVSVPNHLPSLAPHWQYPLWPGIQRVSLLVSLRVVVLILWVVTLQGSNHPFTRVAYQVSCISDIHVLIHNSSKVMVIK